MNNTLLISGANGALGSELVEYFSSRNYQVIAVVRPGHHSESRQNIIYLQAEISEEASVQKLMQEIKSRNLKIKAGLLVAGGFGMGKFLETAKGDLQSMFEKNFFSAFFLAKHLLAHMKEYDQHGKIIFIGAKPALEKGGEATTAYTLAKTLLVKMVEIINQAAEESNVQAALLAPSIIDTAGNRQAMPKADFSQWVKPAEIAQIMEQVILDEGVRRDIIIKAYKGS